MLVAVALEVSLEELLAEPRVKSAFVASAQIPVRERASGLVRIFKLLPDPIPGMEIDRMEIKPGGRMIGTPHLARTKEYLTCIEGCVQVAVAGTNYQLAAGDVLAFPGDLAHSYYNPGLNLTVAVSVVVISPNSS